LSTVEGDVSVVANGAWKGKSLTAIIDDDRNFRNRSLYQIWKTISVAFQNI
jgi:hypothetical protein